MIRRLQRRTWEAPHWGNKQHRSGNYHLTELHHAANTYRTATESIKTLWNKEVLDG